MRPLVAHCHAGLAKFCPADRQRSSGARARQHRDDDDREMGMTYWLEKVEREAAA